MVLAAVLPAVGCMQARPTAQAPTEPRISVSGNWLEFDGPVTAASATAVQQFAAGRSLTGLSIRSEGGDVDAAMVIGDLVWRQGMQVRVRHWCMSSCANYIFTSGTRKQIDAGAIVAWHGSISHLHHLDTVGRGASDPAIRTHNAAVARRETDFLQARGVDPLLPWFGKIAPYNVPNFYALTVADMARFGIRQVDAPASYGPALLQTLPEGMRRGLVFIHVDPASAGAARPAPLQ